MSVRFAVSLHQGKVFAIGANKSGTVSMHHLFKSLGFRSHHGQHWRTGDDLNLLESFDCFSDGAMIDHSNLDAMFPGSRFILQVRDLDSWIYSRLAHIQREIDDHADNFSPAWDHTNYAVEFWVKKRNAHHLFVLDYFRERAEDLLIVNFVRDTSAATKIANFLGFEGDFERPFANVNPVARPLPAHRDLLTESLTALGVPRSEWKNDLYCPSLVSDPNKLRHPADSRML